MLGSPGTGLEGLESHQRRVRVDRPVDVLESAGDGLAILVRHEGERVADQVDDAGLHQRLGEDGLYRLREAFQPIDDGDQDIGHAALLDLVHVRQPELGALGLLDPQAQDFLGSVRAHADADIDRLVLHHLVRADLDDQGVEEDERIDGFQGLGSPGLHVGQNGVRHGRN